MSDKDRNIGKKLIRIIFFEFYEIRSLFGLDWISPGGGMFQKDLIHSFDAKSKVLILAAGWRVKQDGSIYKFMFGRHHKVFISHSVIKRIEFIEPIRKPD